MEILTALMVALLGYQVTMPAVDNAKYTMTVYEGKIVRMNTQNGTFEICNESFICEKPKNKEKQ